MPLREVKGVPFVGVSTLISCPQLGLFLLGYFQSCRVCCQVLIGIVSGRSELMSGCRGKIGDLMIADRCWRFQRLVRDAHPTEDGKSAIDDRRSLLAIAAC